MESIRMGKSFDTRFVRCHARLRRNSIQRAGALMPYQACGLDKKILQKTYPFLQYFSVRKTGLRTMLCAEVCLFQSSYCAKQSNPCGLERVRRGISERTIKGWKESIPLLLVRKTGLEPVQCEPHAPQTCAVCIRKASLADRGATHLRSSATSAY